MKSNDTKYNVIQDMMIELYMVYDYYDYVYSGFDDKTCHRYSKQKVWELANKLYALANNDKEDTDFDI